MKFQFHLTYCTLVSALLPSDSPNETADESDFYDPNHVTNSVTNVTHKGLAEDQDAKMPLSRPHPATTRVVESTAATPITQRQHRRTSGTDGREPIKDEGHHDWFSDDDTEIDDWEQNDQPMVFIPAVDDGDDEEDRDNNNNSDDDVTNDTDKSNGGDVEDDEYVIDGRKSIIRKRSKGLEWTDRGGKSSKVIDNTAMHRGLGDALGHSKDKHSKAVDVDSEDEDSVEDYDLDSPCDLLHCSGSAQCVVDSSKRHQRPTARCRCPLGTTGFYCERGIVISQTRRVSFERRGRFSTEAVERRRE